MASALGVVIAMTSIEAAAAVGNWPGPFNVKTKKTWDYKGICGPGTVYYPDAAGNFPLLSFAHGLFASGTKVTYDYTLFGVASWGFIIIALEGCEGSTNEFKAQEAMMDWAYSHWTTIDRQKPGGIFGHSMGGGSTIAVASDGNACRNYGLQAAVMMHPCNFQTQGGPSWIPALYTSGSRDITCNHGEVYGYYSRDSANHKPRGFGVYKNEGHGGTPPSPPCGPFFNHEVMDIANWFGCYIYGNQNSCSSMYSNFCGDGLKWPTGQKFGCELYMDGQLSDGAMSFESSWESALATGSPMEALSLPWGRHNGTWAGFMNEIRTRGKWLVQQREAYLSERGLYNKTKNATATPAQTVFV